MCAVRCIFIIYILSLSLWQRCDEIEQSNPSEHVINECVTFGDQEIEFCSPLCYTCCSNVEPALSSQLYPNHFFKTLCDFASIDTSYSNGFVWQPPRNLVKTV